MTGTFNIKGAANSSDTKSAIAGGKESDGVKNYQLSFDGVKWFNDNAKFKTSLYLDKSKLTTMVVQLMNRVMFQIIKCTRFNLLLNTKRGHIK